MIYNINNNININNLIIQPIKPSPNQIVSSDTGFPLLKTKVPASSAQHSSSLHRGPLYIISLQTSSLL